MLFHPGKDFISQDTALAVLVNRSTLVGGLEELGALGCIPYGRKDWHAEILSLETWGAQYHKVSKIVTF